ncbi:hypothetical protein, partial [Escherichia coli]|uniref:hypothetical protein n=1 Tax=Escherichia coli TaxID=562 RepID=UPI002000F1DB
THHPLGPENDMATTRLIKRKKKNKAKRKGRQNQPYSSNLEILKCSHEEGRELHTAPNTKLLYIKA